MFGIPRISSPCRDRCARQSGATARRRPAENVSSLRSPVSVKLLPLLDLREPVHLVHPFQHRLAHHLMHLLPAKKIRPPLHQRRFQIRREMFLQKGNILLKKLLLKRFRGSRNHHPPPAANRRNQIRQRLPGPGPRLDHHMLMLLKRVVSNLRHLELRRAKLVPRMPLFKQSSGTENFLDRNWFVGFCGFRFLPAHRGYWRHFLGRFHSRPAHFSPTSSKDKPKPKRACRIPSAVISDIGAFNPNPSRTSTQIPPPIRPESATPS